MPREMQPGGGDRKETDVQRITAPATEAAREWQGWGTALKPAAEQWWLFRKPLSEGTVAANVLRHGTGALNIDASRIPTGENLNGGAYAADPTPRNNWLNKTRPGDEKFLAPRWCRRIRATEWPLAGEMWCMTARPRSWTPSPGSGSGKANQDLVPAEAKIRLAAAGS